MSAFRSSPGALRLLAWSLVARLPLTMVGIGLLVHAQRLTGSFAVAGLVSGAYAVATGAGGPPPRPPPHPPREGVGPGPRAAAPPPPPPPAPAPPPGGPPRAPL